MTVNKTAKRLHAELKKIAGPFEYEGTLPTNIRTGLMEKLEISNATFYRALGDLVDAGLVDFETHLNVDPLPKEKK